MSQIRFEADAVDVFQGRIVIVDPSVVNVQNENEFPLRGRLNNVRRILLTELELPAIDRIVIRKNKTNVNDEFLCIRIGEVPIQVDERFSKSTIETLPIRLDKVGPSFVTISDLELPPGVSIRDEQRTCLDQTVLCQLANTAQIQLEAFVRWSTSLQHAKFQCLSTVCFDTSLSAEGIASVMFSTDGSLAAERVWRMIQSQGLFQRIRQVWEEEPEMRLPRTLLCEGSSSNPEQIPSV